MLKYNILIIVFLGFLSCKNEKKEISYSSESSNFDPSVFELKDNYIKKIRGQVLYMPVYSNIPYLIDTVKFDMSAFLAVHNTDFYNTLTINNLQYFNTKGKLVKDVLKGKKRILQPLETVDFYVPYKDKSGTGANFLIEWTSDSLITEPLIESVTISLKNMHSVGILSVGKVIRELK